MSNASVRCFPALAAIAIAALPIASTARPMFVPALPQACTDTAIRLGPDLAPFAMLAATTITNVGNTMVTYSQTNTYGAIPSPNNDLMGVWPGTAVTGFYPPGLDAGGVGAIYAAGFNTNRGVPMAAQAALTTAYNTAAGAPSTALVSGDLSGVKVPGYPTGTLPPGVYKSNSTLGIMGGNLTLDGRVSNFAGSGGHNAPPPVFIFQVASALTTTYGAGASGNIILKNGANPCNVYWQIGDSATLGGATFYGNVLAYTSITLGASNFTGRALALTGAITIPSAGGSLITNSGGK